MSGPSPRYLITAASGNIGRRLVPLLVSQPSKPELFLVTANADRLKTQLGSNAHNDCVHLIEGNIQDSNFMERTFKSHNITSAFICLTGENELMVTLNLLDAIKQTGTVKHIVYVSASGDFDLDAIRSGAIINNSSGHMLVKYILEAKLRYGSLPREEAGGFSWTVLGPTLFYDNDLRSKHSILESGLFDEPFGDIGVSRVDCDDIALAAKNALEDDGKRWASKKVMIGSRQVYTSHQVAGLWSKALGLPIRHLDSDLEGLQFVENQFESSRSVVWGRDVRLMYDFFSKEGFEITDAQYKEQIELLGRDPSRYEDFITQTASEWKKESLSA